MPPSSEHAAPPTPGHTVRCAGGGYVAGYGAHRPTEAWESAWSPEVPVLCSNLVCRTCAAVVRSVSGHALPDGRHTIGAEGFAPRPIDFAGRSFDLVKALRLVPTPRHRTYACSCRALTAAEPTPLAPQDAHAPALPAWRCAGHPLVAQSAPRFAGTPLPASAAEWVAFVDARLRGTATPLGRATPFPHHPAFTLAHVLLHLRDRTLQVALGRRVGNSLLLHEDPVLRVGAVDLYRLLPRFVGYEGLARALTEAPTLFDGQVAPGSGVALGDALRASVGLQLASGPHPELLSAIEGDLLAGRGDIVFLRLVARDNPSWALAHAATITGRDPLRAAALRKAMQRHGPGVDAALMRALHTPQPP